MVMWTYKGYFLSVTVSKNTECTNPMFFKIRKVTMGIITVKIKIGRILALCIAKGLYLGVIKK